MIKTHSTIKDHFRETRLFNLRAIIAFITASILILTLIARLIYLQIVDHDLYSTLSEDNRFHISAVVPTRGLVYDRNGVILAQNLPSYALEILPERIKDINATVKSLGELIPISESDLERFYEQLKISRPFKPIALRSRLTDEEVARIAVNRHRFPGVDIAASLIRHYPQGGLGVHALGYVGRISESELETLKDESDYDGTNFIGKTGIEKFYESTLHGHVGVDQVETNATGRTLRVFPQVPSEPGLDLHLTIDASMQAIAEQAFGEEKGALVAIDITDGGILTFVSLPTFDPNLFVTGIDRKTYTELQNSPQNPMFNRALRGRYPPGSTVKPFIGLAGLETGVVDPNMKTYCPGYYTLQGDTHKYRDWKKTGHGHVDLETAVVQSCDVYFYDLALTLGIDRLSSFLKQFGFNSLTGVDITGEVTGIMPSREWKRQNRRQPWYPGETLITGIGQGYTSVTPLQLAAATASLASYGKRIQPRVVKAIGNTNDHSIQEIPPFDEAPIHMVKRENWERIISAMTKVVHFWRGTAYKIGKDSKYKIAGKTGTAQVFSVKQDEEYDADQVKKSLRDHALFIAFAPAENPKTAVAVVVENGGHGGSAAAPIAKKVMDYYFEHNPIESEPSTEAPPVEPVS